LVLQAEELLPVQVPVLVVVVPVLVVVPVQLEGRQVPELAGPEERWAAPHQPGAESVEYLENREAAAVR
jgi:hypothetical protein